MSFFPEVIFKGTVTIEGEVPDVKFCDKRNKEYLFIVMQKYGNTIGSMGEVRCNTPLVLRMGI